MSLFDKDLLTSKTDFELFEDKLLAICSECCTYICRWSPQAILRRIRQEIINKLVATKIGSAANDTGYFVWDVGEFYYENDTLLGLDTINISFDIRKNPDFTNQFAKITVRVSSANGHIKNCKVQYYGNV